MIENKLDLLKEDQQQTQSTYSGNDTRRWIGSRRLRPSYTSSKSIASLRDTGTVKTDLEEIPTFSQELVPASGKTEVLEHKNVILNEHWSSIVNIQAKILHFTNSIVTCECLIDSESVIFENRDFPVILFKHLNLNELPYVLISIKSNIGSLKIDVYNGIEFVNKTLFEDDSENTKAWEEITKSQFIKPFEYNPK